MSRSFRDLVVRSSAVNLVVSFVLKGALFVQVVLYARVFAPSEIGTVSTALLVLSFVTLFGQLGLNESIVREKHDPRRIMDTAFSISLATGVLLCAVVAASAALAGHVFGNPALAPFLRVLAVTLFAMPLGLPTNSWVRDFRFGAAKIAGFADVVVATAVTLGLHFLAGTGIWSLVLGRLAGFIANYATVWAIAPYRPRPRFDRGVARGLYGFGWPILVSSLLNFAIWQGDDMLVRYFGGDASLAFYSLAFALPFYVKEVTDIAIASLLPTFSRLSDSDERSRSAFRQANRYLNVLFVPCGLALLFLADPLVRGVFGSKWEPCIVPLRIFAAAFTVEIMGGYSWGILAVARGKTRYLMYVKLWVTFYLLTAGTYCIWRWGIVGGAVYTLTQAVLTVTLVRGWILYQELGSLSYLADSVQPLLAGLVGGAAAVAAGAPLSRGLPQLVVGGVAFAAVSVLAFVALDRSIVSEMRGMLGAFSAGAGGVGPDEPV